MSRDNMTPSSGMLFDKDGNVFDLTLFLSYVSNSLKNELFEFTIYDRRHKEIHNGNLYSLSKIFTVSGSSTSKFGFETGNKYLHLNPPILKTSGPNVEFYGYEDSTYSGGSDEKDNVVNHNLVSTNETSLINIKSGVTATEGNLKFTDFIPGSTGIGGRNTGGNNSIVDEFILNPNKKYSFTVDNKDSNSNKMYLFIEWYETNERYV